ncbi:phospholipid/cholesterol/gamma-HCH transport system substrate-binding protein [Amycolatopsis arida]|uniref:Phospholipid/cholesterol/gamma-HCH transport system substrate-binding protein n=1 Tax=Amycolatopsis arida TaxID=587909 RepID=A0A1I5K687_9PSEU|nr:MlaD family protein [Amycolatopsis arida]TDX96907.1 phospholipid/cholesterol/gamma-HCH transport system substrate-binding protein [Amycolatopsis arida]SFO80624.1 phospholipid/cholesterol/gamma-HCH transport system substrate-binding protein [Amycolatopsis arida]
MLTLRVRVQVIAFVVLALAAVSYIGANFAGVDRLLGAGGYVVRLQLAEGGGLFTNAEVTYRGVAVGRVGELRLTDVGMEADLHIDDSAPPIPEHARAVVANRSAVGEQYVDLQPRAVTGPYLTEGSVIPVESTRLPLSVPTVLGNLSALTESVPTDSLRTVVDELHDALRGAGPHLQVLLDTSTAVTDTARRHLPQTTALLDDGATVLRTQLASAEAWRSFSRDARLFAAELAAADGDLRELIGTAPEAATQLSALLRDNDPELSILLANLLTTADLFRTRTAGMEELFVTLPKAVAATSTAITPDEGRLSMALTFYDPPPCRHGYEGTPYRSGEDTSAAPWNAGAACTLPYGSPSSVRGSQNAPRGGVPPAAVPGAFRSPLEVAALPDVSRSLGELLWPPR